MMSSLPNRTACSSSGQSTSKPPHPARSTTRRNKTIYESMGLTPTQRPSKRPLATGAVSTKRQCMHGSRARPQLTKAPIPTTWSRPDTRLTAAQSNKWVRRLANGSSTIVKFHMLHPLQWEMEYSANPRHYYEMKYGCNGSRQLGVFCSKCNNTRSICTPLDVQVVRETGMCIRCELSERSKQQSKQMSSKPCQTNKLSALNDR